MNNKLSVETMQLVRMDELVNQMEKLIDDAETGRLSTQTQLESRRLIAQYRAIGKEEQKK